MGPERKAQRARSASTTGRQFCTSAAETTSGHGVPETRLITMTLVRHGDKIFDAKASLGHNHYLPPRSLHDTPVATSEPRRPSGRSFRSPCRSNVRAGTLAPGCRNLDGPGPISTPHDNLHFGTLLTNQRFPAQCMPPEPFNAKSSDGLEHISFGPEHCHPTSAARPDLDLGPRTKVCRHLPHIHTL